MAYEATRPGVVRLRQCATTGYTAEGDMRYLTNGGAVKRGETFAMDAAIPFGDAIVRIEKT